MSTLRCASLPLRRLFARRLNRAILCPPGRFGVRGETTFTRYRGCSGMRGESRRRGERPFKHKERAGVLPSRALRLGLPLLASAALILAWGLAAGTLTAAPVAQASGNGQVQIVVPQPDSNNNARGPVGANVTIT